jgi:hypothetical protein
MSYLIPMMALAFAAIIHAAGNNVFDGPVIGCLVTSLAVFTYLNAALSSIYVVIPEFSMVWPAVSIAIAIIGFSRGTRIGAVASVAALAIANAAMADRRVFLVNPPARKGIEFRAVVDTLPLIRSCGGSGNTRFWYDIAERNGFIYRAAASTELFGYRLVSEAFPSLFNAISGSDASIEVGDRILVMSDNANRWRRAVDVLAPLSLDAHQLWSRTVSEADLRIATSCLEVTGFHTNWETQALVPVESFVAPESRGFAAAVGLSADGRTLAVTTNRSTYDWQVRSNAIPVHAGVAYSLEFTKAIDDGGMGVSVADEQGAVMANQNWCSARPGRESRIRFRSPKDSTIRIVLSNCGLTPRVSRFSVSDVRIWRVSSVSAVADQRK